MGRAAVEDDQDQVRLPQAPARHDSPPDADGDHRVPAVVVEASVVRALHVGKVFVEEGLPLPGLANAPADNAGDVGRVKGAGGSAERAAGEDELFRRRHGRLRVGASGYRTADDECHVRLEAHAANLDGFDANGIGGVASGGGTAAAATTEPRGPANHGGFGVGVE